MFSHRSTAASWFVRQIAFGMMVFGLVLTIAATPVRSDAAPTSSAICAFGPQQIWVYDSQNELVDVTDTLELGEDFHWHVTVDYQSIAVYFQNAHVYDLLDNPIGIITGG